MNPCLKVRRESLARGEEENEGLYGVRQVNNRTVAFNRDESSSFLSMKPQIVGIHRKNTGD